MQSSVDVMETTPGAGKASSRPLRWWISANLNTIGLLATLLLMTALFTALSPYFLTVKNLLNIGRAVSIRGIVAAGLTLVMVSGGIDLAIGSNMAASGMLVAYLLRAGMPIPMAALLSVAFGAVLGYIVSLFITKVGISPLITTLGMMSIVRGLGYVYSGGVNISLPGNSPFINLARGFVLGIPNSLVLWVVVCVICHLVLQYTRFGQYTFAIGGNQAACRVAGVRVDRVKTGLYILCAVLAGFGGVLLTSLAGSASPTNSQGAELDIIASVVLGGVSLSGGTGGILGTVLGTLVLGIINNGMTLTGVATFWQVVTRGVVLLLAVTLDSLRTGGLRRQK